MGCSVFCRFVYFVYCYGLVCYLVVAVVGGVCWCLLWFGLVTCLSGFAVVGPCWVGVGDFVCLDA